jgi:DNA polymerase III sliding clamp (beta) subunit (PCNA family)
MVTRTELVEKLETVAPAIAVNGLIPILTHFWFTGKTLLAHNDQIAISVPFRLDFAGAVPDALLHLLKNSRAKDVEFDEQGRDNELVIKAASSKFRLNVIPADDFKAIFEMPKPDEGKAFAVDGKKFVSHLNCCLRSTSIDTSHPDYLGVTLIPVNQGLHFYGTNGATLSHASLKIKGGAGLKSRVCLSAAFCRELLRLADKDKPLMIEIHDGFSLYQNSKGVTIYGKLVRSPKPLDYEGMIDHHFSEADEKRLVPIPTKMELVLERACIIAATNKDPVRTTITVKKGVATFETVSPVAGEVVDTIQLEGKDVKDVSLRVDPKDLRNGYGSFDQLLISDRCVVFANDAQVYMVAAAN